MADFEYGVVVEKAESKRSVDTESGENTEHTEKS
jgi:hypothetical protein